MIGLADRTPAAATAEKRDHMVGIVGGCLEIHEERAGAMIGEHGSSKKRALKAVSSLVTHDKTWRIVCLAPIFKIDREGIEMILDSLWCIQIIEDLPFRLI